MSKGLFVSVDGWAATSMDITVGVSNEAYVPTTDKQTACDYMVALVAWANDGARGWSGAASFSWSILETLTPYLGVQLTASASATLAPDADLQTALGWPSSGQTSTAIYSSSGVPSSCDGVSDVGNWTQRQGDDGNYSRGGSYVLDPQVYALRRPQVELVLSETQAGAFKDALKNSCDPRTAWIYRHSASAWVEIHLGRVDVSKSQAQHYRASLEAIG